MTNFNPEGIKPENKAEIRDHLADELVGLFASLSYNTHDDTKYIEGLLELEQLDQRILEFGDLESIIKKLQEKIGSMLGESKDYTAKTLQKLEDNTATRINLVPQVAQSEADKFMSPSDPKIALTEFKGRHLPVAISITNKNIAEDFYKTVPDFRSITESNLKRMADHGAALGHAFSLHQRQIASRAAQLNP